jgi:hypothetical protein
MRIVSVDPGAHCGLAFRNDDGSLYHTMIHNDLTGVLNYIVRIQPQVIVIERFATGGMISRDGLYTVEMQGAVVGLGWHLGSQVYFQSPMERKAFIPEARNITKLSRSKIDSHDIDAVAHLLCWEYREEHGRQRKPYV